MPPEQRSYSSTQKTKKAFSSQGSVKLSSSVPYTQKPPKTTSGTLKRVRYEQRPIEHSVSVQWTVDSLLSTRGFPEHSARFQKKLGCLSHMVESQDTSPSLLGTTGHLPPKGALMRLHKSKTKTLKNLPSEQTVSSFTEVTKKTLLYSQGSVKPSSSAPHDQKSPQTTHQGL